MANLASTTISGTITEKKGTASISGTTLTVDMSTGNYFEVSLATASDNIATFTITNPPASGSVGSFVIKITQGSTARSFNWATMSGARPVWESIPVIPTEVNAQDIYTFTTYDGGTIWYGSTIGTEFSSVSIYGNRGVFCGGDYEASGNYQNNPAAPMDSDKMDYIAIDTNGNATTFGNLGIARGKVAACSDGQRGVIGGGRRYNFPSAPTHTETNLMEYITIGTPGGSTGFGNLTVTRQGAASTSSPTRGIFAGGYINAPSPTYYNTIDYITIITPDNAVDFGDMHPGTTSQRTACSSGTRGVLLGGKVSGNKENVIDYYSFDYPNNGADFGNLTATNRAAASCSDGTRGICAGGDRGDTNKEKIDYITIAVPAATATNFGDLTREHWYLAGTSNGSRGVFGGGWKDMVSYPPPPNQVQWATETIDYITIATTGNATDFGDLTSTRDTLAACSGN